MISANNESGKITIVKKKKAKSNSTDYHLQVMSLQEYEKNDWDSTKIVDALRNECGLTKSEAQRIAGLAYEDLVARGKHEIDVKMLKSIINYHLLMNGYNGKKLAGQVTLGMSLLDMDNLIHNKSEENSNINNNNPEAVSMTIAENALKQYALKRFFSREVSNAHLEGLLHIHDLGQITRLYCSAHSLLSLAKNGLNDRFGFAIHSSPAQHAQTLVGHLNTFLCTIATYYAGALGVDFVNVYFAPYVDKLTKEQQKQIAQYLIFSLSQSSFSRGGQVLFTDFNLHISIPDWLKKVEATGPGGKPVSKIVFEGNSYEVDDKKLLKLVKEAKNLEEVQAFAKEGKFGLSWQNKTYADYEQTARDFLMVMLEVYKKGDMNGMPFMFPKPDLHVTADDFEGENLKVLKYAAEVASFNGSVYFVNDRMDKSGNGGIQLAACCRLKATVEDTSVLKNIAMKAHLQKKKHIAGIAQNENDPLYEVCKRPYHDGSPYVDLEKATYIMGMVGLNECVKFLFGKELHEDQAAYEFGMKVISFMYSKVKQFSAKHGLKVTLEESPAESAARRLAKTDLLHFSEKAINIVNGEVEFDNVYYTNSIHFRPDADVSIIDRIRKQSKFHNLIESGAIIHAFVGENLPSPDSVLALVKKTFYDTSCTQFVISPEFTVCGECHNRFNGSKEKCPNCGSEKVKHMSRVVGYYSYIESWNVSKKRELQDRRAGTYSF